MSATRGTLRRSRRASTAMVRPWVSSQRSRSVIWSASTPTRSVVAVATPKTVRTSAIQLRPAPDGGEVDGVDLVECVAERVVDPEPGRVLERVPTATSRILLAGAAVLVIAGVIAGATAWAASRSHVVQADEAGQVRLYAGLPYSPLGIALMDDGRPLGVPAAVVTAEDADALEQGIQGEGEATALATRLIWRYGMPQQWKVPKTGGRP